MQSLHSVLCAAALERCLDPGRRPGGDAGGELSCCMVDMLSSVRIPCAEGLNQARTVVAAEVLIAVAVLMGWLDYRVT